MAPITSNDVYAAGMEVGRILRDGGVDKDIAVRVCEVIRQLEEQAGFVVTGAVVGYEVAGKLYHPDDVMIVRAGR
jgi:H+/gluconate symporter-like permease